MRLRAPTTPCARLATATVEFAIVGPIFLMLVFGIIEIGRALMVTEVLTRAATEGARSASLSGSSAQDVQSAVDTFLKNYLITDTQGNSLGTVYIYDAGKQVYPDSTKTATSITFTSTDSVRVEVYVQTSKVTWMPIQEFLKNTTATNLSGKATMIVE